MLMSQDQIDQTVACTGCGGLLTNGLDTFGSVNLPMCWRCYSSLQGEDHSCYGLAPHHHDLERTGSYVGSTVFDLDEHPDFVPDPDDPELGFWSDPAARGWR